MKTATVAATRLLTAEDLEAMGAEAEKRYELIDGVLHEVDGVGGRHGKIEVRMGAKLYTFNEIRKFGEVFSSDTRFIVQRDPDVVMMADVAFVRADRIPPTGVWEGMIPIVPDLAIEIASPHDTGAEVRRKAKRYLDAGVLVVWILWPSRRLVSILRAGEAEVTLNENDVLDGGELLPGFRLPVAEIFAR